MDTKTIDLHILSTSTTTNLGKSDKDSLFGKRKM